MPADPAAVRPYQIEPGNLLTVDIYGADGTRLRVRGVLDSAPEGYGRIATRIVLTDAEARVLD